MCEIIIIYAMKSSELFRNPLSSCGPYPFAIETRERSKTPPGDPGRPLRGLLSILGWQLKLLSYIANYYHICANY